MGTGGGAVSGSRKRSLSEAKEKRSIGDRSVGLDLLIDRRRSERRPIKRDINHSVAKDGALVCMRLDRKRSRQI